MYKRQDRAHLAAKMTAGTHRSVNADFSIIHHNRRTAQITDTFFTADTGTVSYTHLYFLSIIGNRISYYTKKPPAGWHEVSLYLPDVESLILLNWKIIFIYVTMIISAGR